MYMRQRRVEAGIAGIAEVTQTQLQSRASSVAKIKCSPTCAAAMQSSVCAPDATQDTLSREGERK